MSCKRPVSQPRFQKGVNPYSGCNERDFPAGDYIHDVVQQLVRESIEAVLVPAGFTLDYMDFHTSAGDPADPIVRMRITPAVGSQEQHEVRVSYEGVTPWAGQVGPILVAWVKEHYGL